MSGALSVILVKYIRPLPEVEAATPAHRAWLDQHYRNGTFLVSGPREPRTGGLILAQGKTPEELLALLQDDPFHRAGVAEYEVLPFQPVKRHPSMPFEGVPVVE